MEKTLTLSTLAAPAPVFFCRRIEIPAEVAEGERDGFIQLQLESMSPFPLEHLQYGYAIDRAGKYAFLYSGYRRSFHSASMAEWGKQDAVIPDFSIALLSGKTGDGSPLLLVSDDSVSSFEFDDKSELPCRFEGFPREATSDSGSIEDLEAAIKTAKASLADRHRNRNARIWRAEPTLILGKQNLLLRARESDSIVVAPVSREQLWTMDLRDPETLEHAQQEERRNSLLWRGALGLAAGFLLLLLGEGAWLASRSYLELRNTWNAEWEPVVAAIGSKNATVSELEGFRVSDLAPFDMLIAIEPFRTPNVVFSEVETDGPNGLKIFATASNNSQATQFKARLERVDLLDSVVLEDVKGSASGATFTVVLTFKTGWLQRSRQDGGVANNG